MLDTIVFLACYILPFVLDLFNFRRDSDDEG